MNIETADRLIMLRKRKGLSQEELAEKLGISRQAVSKWERAESSPDVDNAIQLSRLYNVSLDELFGNKPEYEIELDSMEPDMPEAIIEEAQAEEPSAEEAPADDADSANEPHYNSFEGFSGFGSELSSSINQIVHDAVSTAMEAAKEAGRIRSEANAYDFGSREISIPAGAATIGHSVYDGIRNLVCSARADLHITGSNSDVCTVSCDGSEKEIARCYVYTVGDTLHIESEDAKRRLFFGIHTRPRLVIYVDLPMAHCIEADLKGGDLHVEAIRADLLNGKTGGGDIRVKGSDFDGLNLKTGGGDIGISATLSQRAELITGGGDIMTEGFNTSALLCARTGGGDMEIEGSAKCIEATTGGGDINIDISAEGVKAATGGGDIAICCRGAKHVNAKTGGGDIKASLIGCTGVTADLASAGGEASVDYKNEKQSSGRKLMMTLGDGSTVLEMRSGGGDIEVKAE